MDSPHRLAVPVPCPERSPRTRPRRDRRRDRARCQRSRERVRLVGLGHAEAVARDRPGSCAGRGRRLPARPERRSAARHRRATRLTVSVGTDPESSAAAEREHRLAGRHPGDRRIRVEPPVSPWFRYVGNDVLTARPAAIDAGRPARPGRRPRPPRRVRAAARERRGGRRAPVMVKALAVFSSDNLSSVAYATEAIMFTLLAAGTSAFWLTIPISVVIVSVLAIIVVSYRQTIRAYPNGGGSYIVAKDNLGTDGGPRRRRCPSRRLRPHRVGQRRGRHRGDHLGVPGCPRRQPRLARRREHRRRHARQPPWHPRERHDIRDPDLCLPGLDAGAARSWDGSRAARRPPQVDRCHARRRADRDARSALADAGIRRRLQRDHRGRGRVERRAGLQATGGAARPHDARRSWACSSG